MGRKMKAEYVLHPLKIKEIWTFQELVWWVAWQLFPYEYTAIKNQLDHGTDYQEYMEDLVLNAYRELLISWGWSEE